MNFESPVYLLALLAIPLALAAYALAQRRRHSFAVRHPGVPALVELAGTTPFWRRHLPAALFAAALAVLAVALARPEATVAVAEEQAAVVLVTDVSGSMRATDVDPSRLAAAQKAARTFLAGVPEDLRVGAVSFSSAVVSAQRPSQDREGVETLIGDLVADGGTATGEGLADALDLFDEERKEGKKHPPSAIVLLSDGKTTLGRDPVEVAREARRRRIPIYTASLGTNEGVVTVGPYGQRLNVPPDPATMRRIARESGGKAFAVDQAEELSTVYERLGRSLGTKRKRREITPWFAAGGMLLLAGAAGSGLHRFGRLP
ncbi:MAG TPA: VWA domain-containing protein [Thermoleophilaceae bacterium]|nr:VWA domain-containing protein [Thermoleophilaceae bacterium]